MGSVHIGGEGVAEAQTLWLALLVCITVVVTGVALLVRLSRSRAALQSGLLAAKSQLSELAGRDPLTGLLSRTEFETALDEFTLNGEHGPGAMALMYIGLDNFRGLNEAYGHRLGDGVLAAAAERMLRHVGSRGLACRLGGDEFVMAIGGDLPSGVRAAGEVLESLQQPLSVEGHELSVSASIGLAVYPDHGARPRLIAHAALAMRSVKLSGGAGYSVYDPAMSVDMRERTELVQDLRHAVTRGELRLFYQPKIDARSLQITAAEALLRWQHPKRGMISPQVFIPLAERHGLIVSIGQWVIEEACRQAAVWRSSGLRMRVAVNISGHQLRQDSLVGKIEDSLRRHGIPAGRLTCEITESVAMEDTAQTRAAFERLRQAGLHVSIDDFGTGHSSLATLRRLPAAELKIDRAFITDLATVDEARTIVQAIVQMARSLSMRVVAEGVENESQRDLLVELGCDELQGYLFAKPMSAQALAIWADDEGPSHQVPAFRPSLFDPTSPASL
jgi:diguanylate cyclase (GGDEF)-like protein